MVQKLSDYLTMNRKIFNINKVKFKSRETLNAIFSLNLKLGHSPTLRELQRELGLGSNNPVLSRLRKLEKFGLVSRGKGPRAIEITKHGFDYLSKYGVYTKSHQYDYDVGALGHDLRLDPGGTSGTTFEPEQLQVTGDKFVVTEE